MLAQVLTAALSLAAVAVAVLSLLRANSALSLRRMPVARVESLELSLAELETRLAALTANHRRLQSRVAMAHARAERDTQDEEELPASDPAAREELKRKLATLRGIS
jgi:hypothetical protein